MTEPGVEQLMLHKACSRLVIVHARASNFHANLAEPKAGAHLTNYESIKPVKQNASSDPSRGMHTWDVVMLG